jgi:hypothetical protein
MRIFVGYGYNERDQWIEEQVFPVLRCMGFTVVDGKDLHGQQLEQGVKDRLDQSDAAVGFFTIRDGQGEADFNSHIWVMNEITYFVAKDKPIITIKEENVRVPDGLQGNRQHILLRQEDRLGCVSELCQALGRRNMRRLKLKPETDRLRQSLHRWRTDPAFELRYKTQDAAGLESEYRSGRLEEVDQTFYLNIADMPKPGFVDIEGILNGAPQFSSGWASAVAVEVIIS